MLSPEQVFVRRPDELPHRRITEPDAVEAAHDRDGDAGIDLSNVAEGWAALLPVDADRSAKHIRDALRARTGVELAVIVSDTFGRPWRRGLTDVAIGVSGIAAVLDLRDTPDALGRTLKVTEVAIADEVASAAELVMVGYPDPAYVGRPRPPVALDELRRFTT